MTSNFILNNFLTYRDQRLKGFAILRGLLLFYLVCSVGLFANVGVAFSVYRPGADLVARGRGGRADGRGLELCDVRTVRLAQAMTPKMNPNEARLVLNTVLTILALVVLRLVAAAYTPITFDEAYYWMWSKSSGRRLL